MFLVVGVSLTLAFQNCGSAFSVVSGLANPASSGGNGAQSDSGTKKITASGPSYTPAGGCSDPFKISLTSDNDQPLVAATNFSMTVPAKLNASFFSDSECKTPVNGSLAFSKGSSEILVYFKDSRLSQQDIIFTASSSAETIAAPPVSHTNFKNSLMNVINGASGSVTFQNGPNISLLGDSQSPFTPDLRMSVISGTESLKGTIIGWGQIGVYVATTAGIFKRGDGSFTEFSKMKVTAIANDSSSYCVLASNEIYCWRSDDIFKVPMPPGEITSFTSNLNGFCALVSGSVYCFNSFGITGAAKDPSKMSDPALLAGLENNIEAIGVAGSYICGLKNKTVACTANNAGIQLARVPGLGDVVRFLGGSSGYSSQLYVEMANGDVNIVSSTRFSSTSVPIALKTGGLKFDEAYGSWLTPGILNGCGRVGKQLYCWDDTFVPKLMTNAMPISR